MNKIDVSSSYSTVEFVYKMAVHFVCWLYILSFAKLFWEPQAFLSREFWFPYIKSHASRDNLTSYFLICVLLISFSFQITPMRIAQNLTGNNSNFSLLNLMLAMDLLHIALIVLRNVPSTLNLLKISWNHERVLCFKKRCLWICWANHMVLFFSLSMYCIVFVEWNILIPAC